jgi:ribosomal protein L11 methyltransferase
MKMELLRHVAVTTGAEAEEAVVALLESQFGETPSVFVDHTTNLSCVSVYLKNSDRPVSVDRRAIREGLDALSRAGVDPAPGKVSVRQVRKQDWSESWKRHFKPIEVGPELLVKPSWSRRRCRSGQKVVILDPGLSFGTGRHPTTAFCLEQLYDARELMVEHGLLDMGTGSGILAISAAKLGYRPVHAFDADPEAVRIATGNATRNRVAQKIELSLQDLTRLPVHAKVRYGVVCANLMDALLIQESKRIVNRLRPGGRLVLAGILTTQFPKVRSVFEQTGLSLRRTHAEGEWQSGMFSSVA